MSPTDPVFRNPWVTVHEEEVATSTGTRRMTRIVQRDGRTGIVIICRTGDRLLLVRQHRHAVDTALWELPRGYGETGDPSDDARRELAEETGLEADQLAHLGAIHPDTGILASRVAVLRATIPADLARRARPGHEVDEVAWFDPTEVEGLIAGGDLRDGISLGALRLEQTTDATRGGSPTST